MYTTLGILKFEDVYSFFILKLIFVHYCLYKNTNYFDSYFAKLLPNHFYETRQTRIHYPSVRVDIEKQNTIFQCYKLINYIDNDLLNPQSDYSLKKKFKIAALAKY